MFGNIKVETYISPNYNQEKFDDPTLDDLVDVLKDRVFNWLFEPAEKLIKEKHGSFAALCLLLTYFEGIWIYITGIDSKGKSEKYFSEAFLDIFQSSNYPRDLLKRLATILYKDGRCGFFHDGMSRGRIYLTDSNHIHMFITFTKKSDSKIKDVINDQIQSILINPKYFVATIKQHFTYYLLCLRNSNERVKRKNFLKIAKEKWDYSGQGILIGLNSDGTKI